MARVILCDMCKKPTDKIVGKVFFSPDSDHGHYTGHADIGECCGADVLRVFKWRKRKAAKVKAAA